MISTWPQVRQWGEVITPQKLQDLGTPSAPPILENGREESRSGIEGQQSTDTGSLTQEYNNLEMDQTSNEMHTMEKDCYGSQEVLSNQATQFQCNEPCTRCAFFFFFITFFPYTLWS